MFKFWIYMYAIRFGVQILRPAPTAFLPLQKCLCLFKALQSVKYNFSA